jgi:hypothetical protein
LQHGERKDVFLTEAQIDDDAEMILRIFNYSVFIALERKKISSDNSQMEIEMPSPVVIYWETSKAKDISSITIKFPGGRSIVYEVPAFKVLQHSVPELEGMALLLPFYILKIREELERSDTDSERKKALAAELGNYITEIESVLKKCQENNYITERDAVMLSRRMAQMHKELYGHHKEFTEVNMRFQELEDIGLDVFDEAVATAEVRGEKRGISKTAKAMKASGEAMDKIMCYTGLSQREIMAL